MRNDPSSDRWGAAGPGARPALLTAVPEALVCLFVRVRRPPTAPARPPTSGVANRPPVIRCHLGSPSVTRCHLESPGVTHCYLESLSVTRCHLGPIGVTWDRSVSPGVTWGRPVSLSVTWGRSVSSSVSLAAQRLMCHCRTSHVSKYHQKSSCMSSDVFQFQVMSFGVI